MTFPLYSPDDIISYLRSHILEGAEARNLVKSDVFGNPKVHEGGAGRLRAPLAAVWDGRAAPARVTAGLGWARRRLGALLARKRGGVTGSTRPALASSVGTGGKIATVSSSGILPDPFSAFRPSPALKPLPASASFTTLSI